MLKIFDKWEMEGVAERIKYLQNYYKLIRDGIERAIDKYLGGK